MSLIWTSIIVALGLSSMWLLGSKRIVGWYVILVIQLMWVPYAIITGQYPFIVSGVVYAVICVRSIRRWRTTHPIRSQGHSNVCCQHMCTPSDVVVSPLD
jgi:hypothetical protein